MTSIIALIWFSTVAVFSESNHISDFHSRNPILQYLYSPHVPSNLSLASRSNNRVLRYPSGLPTLDGNIQGYSTSYPGLGYSPNSQKTSYPVNPNVGYSTSYPALGNYPKGRPTLDYPISNSALGYPSDSSKLNYPTGNYPGYPGNPTSNPALSYPNEIPSLGQQISTSNPDYLTSKPALSYPSDSSESSYPIGNPNLGYPISNSAQGYPIEYPSSSYPADNPTVRYPTDYPAFSDPTNNPTVGYPTDYATLTYPTGNPTLGYPTDYSTLSYPTNNPYLNYPTGSAVLSKPQRTPVSNNPLDNPALNYRTDNSPLDKRPVGPKKPMHFMILYGSLLNEFDNASNEVKRHTAEVSRVSGSGADQPLVQYAMIFHALDQLMDGLVENVPYDAMYKPIVRQAINNIETHPQAAVESFRNKMDIGNSQISELRDFIRYLQQTACEVWNSYECNLIIQKALENSRSPILKQQAKLLAGLSDELRLFIKEYAEEFDRVANSNDAYTYLINNSRHLKPFVIAGAEAKKVRLGLGEPTVAADATL